MKNEFNYDEFMKLYAEANALLEEFIAINKNITNKLQSHEFLNLQKAA